VANAKIKLVMIDTFSSIKRVFLHIKYTIITAKEVKLQDNKIKIHPSHGNGIFSIFVANKTGIPKKVNPGGLLG
jgi:hypothetical protein